MKKRICCPLFCILVLSACSGPYHSEHSSQTDDFYSRSERDDTAKSALLSYPFYRHAQTPGETGYSFAPSVIWDGYTDGLEKDDETGEMRQTCFAVEKGSRVTYEIEYELGTPCYLFAYLPSSDYPAAQEGYSTLKGLERNLDDYFDTSDNVIDGKYLAGHVLKKQGESSLIVFRSPFAEAPAVLKNGERLVLGCAAKKAQIVYDLPRGEKLDETCELLKKITFSVLESGVAVPPSTTEKEYPNPSIEFEAKGRFIASYPRGLLEESPFLYSETGRSEYPLYFIEDEKEGERMLAPIKANKNADGSFATDYLNDGLILPIDLYGVHKEEFKQCFEKDAYYDSETNRLYGYFDYEGVKSIVAKIPF